MNDFHFSRENTKQSNVVKKARKHLVRMSIKRRSITRRKIGKATVESNYISFLSIIKYRRPKSDF